MTNLKDQRVCIKFGFKLGRKYYGMFEILKVYFGEQTMGRTQV
jgi:hypothetical protein